MMESVSPSTTQMNSESKHVNGGKVSPPVCEDHSQQPNQQPLPQRTTRYINNSTIGGGISKNNSRSNSSTSSITTKNKSLVRSHAVDHTNNPPSSDHPPPSSDRPRITHQQSKSEETSPSPSDGIVVMNNKNGKLRQQNSQQSSSLESSLSIDNNVGGEKQGHEDNELLDFIVDTLNKNVKDRSLILRIESDLTAFIKDPKRTQYSFPTMTSYQRMLVHRVSGYFHLEHNLDSSATCVVVTKTKNTRVPETRFKDYIEEHQSQESNSKTVLKRENVRKANEDQTQHGMNKFRGKSLEERAEDYNRVRKRIFNNENHQQDPGAGYCWSSTESNTTNDPQGKGMRHINRRSNAQPSSTLLKVESFETATTNRKNKPPVVNKSYSFGGIGASDGSANLIGASNNMGGLNRFSKQDSSSSSSGLSPASSGYKSQSFQSSTENTMTTPNSSTSPQNLAVNVQEQPGVLTVEGITPQTVPPAHQLVATTAHQSQQQYYYYPASSNFMAAGVPLQMTNPQTAIPQQQQQTPSPEHLVLWAVSDLNQVPQGALLIDPNTGKALQNSDGTTYHYNPTNPPKVSLTPQSELMYHQSHHHHHHHQQQQQHHQQQQIQPQGDVEQVTQWISHMALQPAPPQSTHQVSQVAIQQGNHQWGGGEEYYVAQPQPPPSGTFVTGGPILWDPKMSTGAAIGLNQQYYINNPVPAHPPSSLHQTQPQQHFLMTAAPQAPHQVMMQYSVPTSSSATPYMSYMIQPSIVAAAANYNNLVQYGQQQSQPQRPIHHNAVHHQQSMKLTTPTPTTNNTAACIYNPFFAATHVQNQQPGGGSHRFPGNPQAVYQPPGYLPGPRPAYNYRSNVKQQRRGNRTRNYSSNDRSSTQQQQQHQASDKNS